MSRVPMFPTAARLSADPPSCAVSGSVHMGKSLRPERRRSRASTPRRAHAIGLETQTKAGAGPSEGAFARSLGPVPADNATPASTTTGSSGPARPPSHSRRCRQPSRSWESTARHDIALACGAGARLDGSSTCTPWTLPAVADAAALLLVGSAGPARATGLAPRARIASAASTAVDPVVMLIAAEPQSSRSSEGRPRHPATSTAPSSPRPSRACACASAATSTPAGPDGPGRRHDGDGHASGATEAILVGQCVRRSSAVTGLGRRVASAVPPDSARPCSSSRRRLSARRFGRQPSPLTTPAPSRRPSARRSPTAQPGDAGEQHRAALTQQSAHLPGEAEHEERRASTRQARADGDVRARSCPTPHREHRRDDGAGPARSGVRAARGRRRRRRRRASRTPAVDKLERDKEQEQTARALERGDREWR